MTQEEYNNLVGSVRSIDFVNNDMGDIAGLKFFNFEGDLAQMLQISDEGATFEVYGGKNTYVYNVAWGEEPQIQSETKPKVIDGIPTPELEEALKGSEQTQKMFEAYDISGLGFSVGKEFDVKSWDDFEDNFKSFAKNSEFETLPMWFNDGGHIKVKITDVNADTTSGLKVTVSFSDGSSKLENSTVIYNAITHFFEEDSRMPQILNESEDGDAVGVDAPRVYAPDELVSIRNNMQANLQPMEYEEFLSDWEATSQSPTWPQAVVVDALLARHNTSVDTLNENAVYSTPANTPSDMAPAPFVADYMRTTDKPVEKKELEKDKYYTVNESVMRYKGSALGGKHNTEKVYEFTDLEGKSHKVGHSSKVGVNAILEGLNKMEKPMPFDTFCEITKAANVYEALGHRVSAVTGPARQVLEIERSLKSNYICNLSEGYNMGVLKSAFEDMKVGMPVRVYEAPVTRTGDKPADKPAETKSSPEKEAIKAQIKTALDRIHSELDAKTEEIKIHIEAIKENYADKYAQLKANKDTHIKTLEGKENSEVERERIVKDYTDKKEKLQLQEAEDTRTEKQKIADLQLKAAQLEVKIKMQDPDMTPEKKTELDKWLAERKKAISDQMIDLGKTADTIKDKAYSLIGESLKKQPRKLNESADAGFAFDAKTICEAVMNVAQSIGMNKMSLGDLCEMLKSEFNANDLSEALISTVERGLKAAGMNIVYEVNEAKIGRRLTKNGRKPVNVSESFSWSNEGQDDEAGKISNLEEFLAAVKAKGEYTESTPTPSVTIFKVGDKPVGEWHEFDNYGKLYESAQSVNESVDTSEYAKFGNVRDFTELCKQMEIADDQKTQISAVMQDSNNSDQQAYTKVAAILGDKNKAKDILTWWGADIEDINEEEHDDTTKGLMDLAGVSKSFVDLCKEWDIDDSTRSQISKLIEQGLTDQNAMPDSKIAAGIKRLVPSPGAQKDIIDWWKLKVNEALDPADAGVQNAVKTAAGAGKSEKRRLKGDKISSALYSTIRGTEQAKEFEWNSDEQLYTRKTATATNEGKSTPSLAEYHKIAEASTMVKNLSPIQKGDGQPIVEFFTLENEAGEEAKIYTSADHDEVTIEYDGDDDDIDLDGFKNYVSMNESVNESKIESSITRGGSPLYPETLEVSNGEVTWTKRNKSFLSKTKISIPLDKIAGINHQDKLIGSDIIISSSGGEVIKAEGFVTAEIEMLMKEMRKSPISESLDNPDTGRDINGTSYQEDDLAQLKGLYPKEEDFVASFECNESKIGDEDKQWLSNYHKGIK